MNAVRPAPRRRALQIALVSACILALWGSVTSAASAPLDACADCHGKDGASVEHDVPIIGGLSEAFLSDAMDDYRTKARPCPESRFRSGDTKRPATDMCRIAGTLSKAETAEVVKTLAAKPFVRATQAVDAAQAELGRKVHATHCDRCHTKGGSVADDDAGMLAGQHLDYLQQAFKEFADGSRPIPKKMKPRVEELTADERAALLQYYGSFR